MTTHRNDNNRSANLAGVGQSVPYVKSQSNLSDYISSEIKMEKNRTKLEIKGGGYSDMARAIFFGVQNFEFQYFFLFLFFFFFFFGGGGGGGCSETKCLGVGYRTPRLGVSE